MAKQNSVGQDYTNNADGWSLGGGIVKRLLSLITGNVTIAGTGSYVHTFPSETCRLGKQRLHGNGAFYDNNCIHGKAGMAVISYTGNATARDIEAGFFPHSFFTKAITAVQGIMWTYWGMNKGSAVANTVGDITRVTDAGTGVRLGATAGSNTNAAGYRALALCAHDGSLTKMKSKVITWTGNASDNRQITGVGFQAKYVIVKGAGAQSAVCKSSLHVGDTTSYFLIATADLADAIQTIDADGITIGTNATVNGNGVVYTGMFFADDVDGDSDFALTKYTGIAGDGYHIELPFQPNILFLIPGAALVPLMWNSAMADGKTGYVSAATADVSDAVIKADAFGFTVGNNVTINLTNQPTHVIAIRCDGNT